MHPFPLLRDPRQYKLTGHYVLLMGDLLDLLDQFEVLVKSVRLETRVLGAPVASDVRRGFYAPSEKAATQRRVGHHCDAEFFARVQDRWRAGLDFERPGRVFDLK